MSETQADYEYTAPGHTAPLDKPATFLDRADITPAELRKLKAELAEARAELRKWNAPHEDGELEEMRQQALRGSMGAQQAYINALTWHWLVSEGKLRKDIDTLKKALEFYAGLTTRDIWTGANLTPHELGEYKGRFVYGWDCGVKARAVLEEIK